MKEKNIVWHNGHISKESRNKLLGFKNKVIWFTGLSGSGKSTIARELEKALFEEGSISYVLDGDNVRHGLNNDLGFSEKDREENIRRIGEVSKLFFDAGVMVIVCFISPYEKDRNAIREKIGKDFIEIFVDCRLEDCEKRDPKGLYKKARAGEIKEFTGISAPYEKPKDPEISLNTSEESVKECVTKIREYLKNE